MLQETGRVVAIDEDGLWLETLKKSVCGQCAAKSGCGQQLLAKASASNMTFVKALFPDYTSNSSGTNGRRIELESNSSRIDLSIAPDKWKEGDIALVEIDEDVLVRAALIAYILPLLFMILTAWVSSMFLSQDILIAIMAFLGLVFGGVIVSWLARNGNQRGFHAQVVGKA